MRFYVYIIIILSVLQTISTQCTTKKDTMLILNDEYKMTTLETFIGLVPNQLYYHENKIFLWIRDKVYRLKEGTTNLYPYTLQINFKYKSVFVDVYGNRIRYVNSSIEFWDYQTKKNMRIVTDDGLMITGMNVDMDKSRIFLRVHDPVLDFGYLHAFDTLKPNKIDKKIETERIKIKSNVLSISLDEGSGKLAVLVLDAPYKWTVKIFEPINLSGCKTPSHNIQRDSLKKAINLAGAQIFSSLSEVYPIYDTKPVVQEVIVEEDCGEEAVKMEDHIKNLENALNITKKRIDTLIKIINVPNIVKLIKEYTSKSHTIPRNQFASRVKQQLIGKFVCVKVNEWNSMMNKTLHTKRITLLKQALNILDSNIKIVKSI